MPEPYLTDELVTLFHGDCLDVLRELPDASVDAVVTDPPYGLAEHTPAVVAKAFQAWLSGDRDHVPDGRGFMGRRWDRFVPPPAVFDECLRVLKPGGHLLCFAGSRTHDLMATSIRFAGFEIRDGIAWLYGSGFPKSLDVSKAIDKRAEENAETKLRIALVAEVIRTHREAKGMERAEVSEAVVGTRSGACWNWEHQQLPSVEMWPAIKRALDISDDFDGLIEGDRAQFIAAEREVLRTRRAGRLAVAPGQGEDRSARDLHETAPATDAARAWQGWGTALKPAFEPIVVARKPLAGTVAANVLEHGTGALNIDGCRMEANGRPLIESRSEASVSTFGDGLNGSRHAGSTDLGRWPANVVLDEDQAAELDAVSDLASRFFYTAKAPSRERVRLDGVAHPTVKPLSLMRWLVRLVTPPGGVVLEPFAGSGTTVEACVLEGFRCVAIEREADYLPLIRRRIMRRTDPLAVAVEEKEDLGLVGIAFGIEQEEADV